MPIFNKKPFTDEQKRPPFRPSVGVIDQASGRMKMVKVSQNTADDINSYSLDRLSKTRRYVEKAFAPPDKTEKKSYVDCEDCSDLHVQTVWVDYPIGTYQMAYKCHCHDKLSKPTLPNTIMPYDQADQMGLVALRRKQKAAEIDGDYSHTYSLRTRKPAKERKRQSKYKPLSKQELEQRKQELVERLML